jgi:hypothetical protein
LPVKANVSLSQLETTVKDLEISMRHKVKKARRQVRKTGRKKVKTSAVIGIEEFYKIANHIQIDREETSFSVVSDNVYMVENLLKDLELPFVRVDKKGYSRFMVSPGKERSIEDDDDEFLDEFPDEIAEDGQIFF